MKLLDQKMRKHFLLRQHVLSTVCLARNLLSSKANNTQQTFQAFQTGLWSFSHGSEHLLHNGNLQRRQRYFVVSKHDIQESSSSSSSKPPRYAAMLEKKVTEIEADSYI